VVVRAVGARSRSCASENEHRAEIGMRGLYERNEPTRRRKKWDRVQSSRRFSIERAENVPMKTIKDSVHDHIEVSGVARELLDTPPVQRLRHVRQLGTVELVYPSANHTRFEHSLGVYHLADRALSQLGIEGREAERVRAAALL